MTAVNATGFKTKKSNVNASAKAGTAAKWVSQAVLAQRREAGQCLRCGRRDIGLRIAICLRLSGRARRPESVFAMSPRRRRKTPTATIRKKTSSRLKTRRRGRGMLARGVAI
ncbi:hypothetical protein E4U17_007869 [Claviceps sp. LM77 group G4]|nr:hypothetical protein E4U17_007869 [Claviceps sp. LM77 group G4]